MNLLHNWYFFKKIDYLTWQFMFNPPQTERFTKAVPIISTLNRSDLVNYKIWILNQYNVKEKDIKIFHTNRTNEYNLQLIFDSEADEALFILKNFSP